MIDNYSLSGLKFKKVIDAEGSVYGRVTDLLLHKDTLLLKGLIITGGRIEELMERFKFRQDKDPLLLLSQISKVTKEALFLGVEISELQNATEFGSDNYIRFSDLSRMNILDMNGNVVGQFHDVIFDETGLNYQLGGDVFSNLLTRNHSSSHLNYCISPTQVYVTSHDYRVKISILEMEEEIKFSLDHVPRDVRVLANSDGVVNSDEEALISTLLDHLPDYFKLRPVSIHEDWNADLLDQEKEEIMQALIHTAKTDHIISDDESAILQKFAAHFFSRKKVEYYLNLV